MMKCFLSLYILLAQIAWSQDLARDMDFLETQNTLSTPFNIPVYVNLQGEVSFISRDQDSNVSINALGHINARLTKSLYIKPIKSDGFGFFEQRRDIDWFEIRRERAEIGGGINANIGTGISVGLSGFKGARNVMTRTKVSKEEKTKRPTMPDSLDEVLGWRNGDLGSFQRFGGVAISAGVSLYGVTIISGGLVLQNLWSLTIQKVSNDKVKLTLAEEDLKKRQVKSGATVANYKANFFKGKRLTAHFTLDPKNELHHQLFKDAIKGRLDILQEKLPADAQKMSWKGSESMFYMGIPSLIGKTFQRSEYVMQIEDEKNEENEDPALMSDRAEPNIEEEVLDVKTKRNSGILIPMRNHNRLVYQTDRDMTIFWYSEMQKADISVVDKHFIRPGRLMGVKGFDTDLLPPGTMIGATMSQIGMTFTREEIDAVDAPLLEQILVNFKQRCEELSLSCARKNKFKKIKKKLTAFLTQKWEVYRDNLGFIMVDEPALVNAYLKTINAKKKIYFKFLNQKYQSLEGTAPIEY